MSKDEFYYNNKWFYDSLKLLKDQVEDLKQWSAYNNDNYIEEILKLEEIVDEMQIAPTSAKELEDTD